MCFIGHVGNKHKIKVPTDLRPLKAYDSMTYLNRKKICSRNYQIHT